MSNDAEVQSEVLEDDAWGAALSEQAEGEQATLQEKKEAAGVFKELSENSPKSSVKPDINFIYDIPVQLTVELGRTKITVKSLLQLAQGSVIELNGLAGEPMDVLVNGCLIAQGEVVVVNDKFGIRLTDITSPADRIRKFNR
jgi:flagellar motor switch protein FliN/FliY